MKPVIGKYNLEPNSISPLKLQELIAEHFSDGLPEDMQYYYVVHDELMDILEQTSPRKHVPKMLKLHLNMFPRCSKLDTKLYKNDAPVN